MAIEDIIHITISRQSQTVSRASFAIGMIIGHHSHWGVNEKVRSYSSGSALATLVSEGFLTTDPIYKAAAVYVAQNPRPDKFLVGRLSTAWNQKIRITPVAANTTVYSGTVAGAAWTFTSDGSATLAEACTGIASAIDALPLVTADGSSGTHIDVNVTAADTLVNTAKGTSAGVYDFEDVTPATNLVSEITALRLVDSTWYGLLLDNPSSLRIEAVAAYAETLQTLCVANTADSTCLDPTSTTDVMATLHTSNYARTATIYHPDADSFAGAAWMAAVLPYDAGGATWAYKVLRGVSTPTLTQTQQDAIAAKMGNFYIAVSGVSGTRWGVTASGEYIDTTECIDWAHSRWGERLFGLLSNTPKLPYTDASGVRIKSEIGAVNGIGVRMGIFAADPPPTVTVPRVAAQDPADRAARIFSDVEVVATLAGAIHEINVSASLTF